MICSNKHKRKQKKSGQKYRPRMQTERRDSGVEVEQTELDQAVEEINEK